MKSLPRTALRALASSAVASVMLCAPAAYGLTGPSMVKDINSYVHGSDVMHLTTVGSHVFFQASDDPNAGGVALWKSDGTAAGTTLVKRVFYQADYDLPQQFVAMNNTLYFSATDTGLSRELWKSDGTAAGTVKISSICSGCKASPQYPTAINNTLFFTAFDVTHGRELWKSDGTTAGTVLVKDIFPGGSGSDPSNLANLNGTLMFLANENNAIGLWKSDGTAAGTVLIKSLSGRASGTDQSLAIGGAYYFIATNAAGNCELWKSDGTTAGTVMISPFPNRSYNGPSHFVNLNGLLYFVADDGVHGRELWKSDGTSAGTVLVKDIAPGSAGGSMPTYFYFRMVPMNGVLYFHGDDGVHGLELWRTDGTEAGTVMVKDLAEGAEGAKLWTMVPFNSALYFLAEGKTGGTIQSGLWKTDGTEAGTVFVKPLLNWSNGKTLWPIAPFNALLFSGSDGTAGHELWKTDGTTAGTVMVKDIRATGASSDPSNLGKFGGGAMFTANDGSGVKLWKSDGTAAGTQAVKALTLDSMTFHNGLVFFNSASQIWKSDGTDAGTVVVKSDLAIGESAASVGNTLYFAAKDTTQPPFSKLKGLWKTDGTSAGTVMVKGGFVELVPAPGYPQMLTFTEYKGQLYFIASDGTSPGASLWKSDGTAAGTVIVKPGLGPCSESAKLAIVNDLLYLCGSSGGYGRLWKSDGTTAGTVQVSATVANPRRLLNLNGLLLFTAAAGGDGSSTLGIWKSDGTASGTVLVKNLGGLLDAGPFEIASTGSLVFFTNEGELWKTDGTTAGTGLVKDIYLGASSYSFPEKLTAFGGMLYFVANDGVHGKELWRSDGTAAGTVLLGDLNPGTADSNPADFTVSGNKFFFTATAPLGKELWIVQFDGTPDSFGFTAQAGVPFSSLRTSNTIVPAGYEAGVDISVSGGEYSIGCNASFTPLPGTLSPGQSVCVRHVSAATSNTSTVTTLTIGDATASFTTTTLSLPQLTLTKTGAGSGTVSSAPAGISCGATCTQTFASGTSVILTAAANAGSMFAGWTNCPAPSGNQCTATLNSSLVVTARFDLSTVRSADFNGDGRSDLLWYNSATGMLYELQMNGLAVGPSAVIDQETDLNWKVVAVADLNGDGRADVVWQSGTTGQVYGLLMNGTTVASEGLIYVEPNTQWKIVGAGDFNGDGSADLLWKNDVTGDVFLLLMNGLAVINGGVIYSEPNTNWKIQKVADFNGDGRADVLWRNTATGDVFVLLMNGTTVTGGGVIYSEPNTAWQIQAAADFNGDGRADVLWRNTTTGDVFMMLMNGTTIIGGSVFYGEPNGDWKIVATGDYNGDGNADIVWRDTTTGQVFMMLMNGFAILSGGFVYAEPDQNWSIVGQ